MKVGVLASKEWQPGTDRHLLKQKFIEIKTPLAFKEYKLRRQTACHHISCLCKISAGG
jgi:hypothetical protein